MGDALVEPEIRRCAIAGLKLKIDIILPVREMLHKTNGYVTSFKTALEKMDLSEHHIIIHPDKAPAGEHSTKFNASGTDEVAVLIVKTSPNET